MAARKPVSFDTSTRVVNQAGSEYALSWWVITLFSVPTFVALLVFDQSRLGGKPSDWFQIALAAQAVALLVFGLGRVALLPNPKRINLFTVLTLYGLVGLARALFIHYTALEMGVEGPNQFAYRVLSGPVYAISLMGVCAVLVSNIKRHRLLQSELAVERGRLRLASAKLRSQVEAQHSELVARVSAMIGPAIQGLENKLSDVKDPKTTSIAVLNIKNTVDDVIRPLSHDIGRSNFDELMLQTEDQIRAQVLPRIQKTEITLLPNFSALLMFSVALGTAILTRGLVMGLFLALILAFTLWIWNSTVQRLLGRRKFRVIPAGFIYVATYFMGGIVTELVLAGVGMPASDSEKFGSQALITMMGGVFYFATVTNAFRLANIEKLRIVNRRFQLLNSQLRRQVWLEHRRIASILHGQLQGALYAAAMRLNQAPHPDKALIDDVRSEINSALSALNDGKNSIEDFTKVYHDIIDLWSDSVTFETEFTSEASGALANDLNLAECVLEVVREAINNAVKHGKTTAIWVRGRMQNSQVLEVTVENSGSQLEEHSDQGYGSEVLTQCTHSWKLENTGDRVKLTATFAV